MATKKVRVYTWYIEPLDLNTNEALSRELASEDAISVRDSNGKSRKVYVIPAQELSKFRNSKADAGFKFNVLGQEGKGKIRDANFLPAIRRKSRLRLLIKRPQTAVAA